MTAPAIKSASVRIKFECDDGYTSDSEFKFPSPAAGNLTPYELMRNASVELARLVTLYGSDEAGTELAMMVTEQVKAVMDWKVANG